MGVANVGEWMTRFRAIIVAALAAAFALVASYLVFAAGQQPKQIVVQSPTATAVVAKEIKVYVSGAVAKSGVYALPEDSRVEDAIRAAGGPLDGADLERVNPARKLHDEMQIHVPKVGEALSTGTGAVGKTLININTAPAEELDKMLWGIGVTTAAKIVDYRCQHGPFSKIEDLVDLKLVNKSVFERIRDQITVE